MYSDNEIPSIDDLVEAMLLRVSKINLNNEENQHKGGVFFAKQLNLEEHIKKILTLAMNRIQLQFHAEKSDVTAGSAKLTALATGIGKATSLIFKVNSDAGYTSWCRNVNVGGFVIDLLVRARLVEMSRDDLFFVAKSHVAPVLVKATDKWTAYWAKQAAAPVRENNLEFTGIVFNKPSKITHMFNSHNGRPLVKRAKTNELFLQMQDSTFIKGVEGMQQTCWKTNDRVVKAITDYEWSNVSDPIPKAGNKATVDAALKEKKIQLKKMSQGKQHTHDEATAVYEKASLLWAKKREALKKRSRISERNCIITKAKQLQAVDSDFYYLIEADYRGRVYYSEPYLHYQGNDMSKGMLMFSEGKAVSEGGLFWLFVHAACSYNAEFSIEELEDLEWFEHEYESYLKQEGLAKMAVDKMSIGDRAAWVSQNLDLIYDVADNNLLLVEDTELHKKAEKPAVFLAVCIEIANAIRAAEKGEEYLSHLPVPVDGSNSGYQHTASINRDEDTAKLVGIIPSDFPSDLYVKVGQEMMNIAPEFFTARPNMTMKDIRKNLSKRSCMVRGYSAGASSISEGMFADCYRNDACTEFNISALDCDEMAKVAIEAIDIACPSNKTVREFLQQLVGFELGVYQWQDDDGNDVQKLRTSMSNKAKRLSKDARQIRKKIRNAADDVDMTVEQTKHDALIAERDELNEVMRAFTSVKIKGNGSKTIDWTAPSGFKVVCKLNRTNKFDTDVSIGGESYNLAGQLESDIPDRSDHISGIAANFVHSHDSSHMLMIVEELVKRGMFFFGGVHDSFSVHCSDMDEMIQITKDTLKLIYDVPCYYSLMIESLISNKEGLDVVIPVAGNLDFACLDDADYLFS